ncbi:MAG: glycosyltransferase family 2 protein [Actinomycetota bacterium]
MSALRILGAILAVALFFISVVRYRRRQISRLSLVIGWIIATGVVLLALDPNLFNPLFDTFNFQPGSGRRLDAVLLVAVAVLFALLLRTQAQADSNERSIRLLVEALAQKEFDWDAARALLPGRKIATVSPAFNEEENLGEVLRRIPRELEGYQVISIVVDDGSEDATVEVARAGGALVASNPIRRGGGLALRVGYDIAIELGADIVVTVDADGQHMPEELPVMIEPILAGRADYVNGSRLLGEFESESTIRHIGVHFFSWLTTILTGQRITDISSGYRAATTDLLRKLVLEQDQFWTSEVLIEALRHRARIVEVPVTIEARKGGKSKKPKSLKYGYHFGKAILQTWLR